MSAIPLRSVAALAADLPHVWQGQAMGRADSAVVATGHAVLDAQLPGGGWPLGLVELLQAHPAQHVWQLLAPALAQALQSRSGPVVLVAPPFEPFAPSLQAQGLPGERLLWVRADPPAARLWSAEQALRCADVAAVLAWLPQARSTELRRLQVAAQQHSQLLFVLRPLRAAQEASPARVRLQLEGAQELQLRILKRRGPPLETPLLLPAHPPRLAALLDARKRRAPPPPPQAPAVLHAVPTGRRSHVLDRIAALT